MVVKFFLYNKIDGVVSMMLPELPDNIDYIDNGIIEFAGTRRATGIKWANVGVWLSDIGVELAGNHHYTYDPETNEIADHGVIND